MSNRSIASKKGWALRKAKVEFYAPYKVPDNVAKMTINHPLSWGFMSLKMSLHEAMSFGTSDG